jgi:hypothetical protein
MEYLTRGGVAREGGVNSETIRYYEQRGLLPKASRLPSGYRMFQPDAVRRIRFIKRAQELGFSLISPRSHAVAGVDCGLPRCRHRELCVSSKRSARIWTRSARGNCDCADSGRQVCIRLEPPLVHQQDRCWYFYVCPTCHAVLKPQAADCCVFCSYGSVKCPSKQADCSVKPRYRLGGHL